MTNSLIQEILTSIIILFVVSFTTVSCDKEVPTGDVEGIIFFAGTNIPVNDVTVDIDGMTALSSMEGSYRIEGIPTGKYTLKANKTGFIPFSKEITIEEGAITVLIHLSSPVFTFSVRGIITGDFTGNPQPGLIVVMLNPDGTESELKGTTDSEGYYQIQNVPFGDRNLVVKSSNTIVFQSNISISAPDYQLDMTIPEPLVLTDERDGRSYTASRIGNQTWMVDNLEYMPLVCPPDWESDTLALYYVYGYHGTDLNEARGSNNYNTYGVLYNYKAAMSACPDGWHLPSDDEWKVLEVYLGMEPEDANQVRWRMTGDVGMKLKSVTGWEANGSGNNSSGFDALPGGSRGDSGTFSGIGSRCNFWTSTLSVSSLPWNRFLSFDNNGVSRYGLNHSLGFSVRCIKDN